MKKYIILLFLVTYSCVYTQQYNVQKGYVAKGYDVVAYFNNTAVEGKKQFQTTHHGVKFKFSSKENLELFAKNPEKYIPQYGGYCAYAIGKSGKKVNINPKTFEIRNNKLYLFYNSWGTNTLTLWKKEGANKLQKQADVNWKNREK